jgi:acyl dehydratase
MDNGDKEDMSKEPSFEELVDEWLTGTKAMIDREEEILEGVDIRGVTFQELQNRNEKPPWEMRRVDNREIRNFAGTIGDKNPLYWDPDYAATTRYRTPIAPPTIVMRIRGASLHGARRKGAMYPIANYFSGVLWNWYDVIRPSTRVFSESKYAEILEKKGKVAGRMFIMCSNGRHWDQRKTLFSTVRGHIVMVPMPSRTDTENVGGDMLYERPPQAYTPEEITKIAEDIEHEVRRGATPRYWEDVAVGDMLPPVVKGPFTEQDQATSPHDSFELAYNHGRYAETMMTGGGARMHPVTRWPWSAAAEHEDYLLCRYRGLPGPFDAGAQRCCYSAHLLLNWAGDDGFYRRGYYEVRFPKYSTDTTWIVGEVVRKYKVVETGEKGTTGWEAGGIPGKAEYAAVDIKVIGTNQIGEKSLRGMATIYLPSRDTGDVQLPIPHPPKPKYMNFPRFSDDVPDYRRVPSAI